MRGLLKRQFFILVTGMVLLQVACNPSRDKLSGEMESSTAYFDSFEYKGMDDFYAENPLPGEDYFYNPILPGWYSDPSVCTNGEDFFLVTSTFSYFPGVPIFHSKDLMNWKQIGHVLDRVSQLPLDSQRISEGIFAPAISYNPQNKTYYMITTNIRKGNFFVKTQDPFGQWSEPVWLPDVHGIDPSFFFDDDGKAYIVNNEEPDGGSTYDGHRAICVHQFDVETEKTVGPRKMIINGGVNLDEKPVWIEGPHLYKINGTYYLMCAEGGTSVNHREVIFKGDSPMGTFKPWENNPILTQKHLDENRPLPVTCAGHADLIQKKDGTWWSVFLACRPLNNQFENLGRETFIMPVRWTEDGYPLMTEGDEVVPRILKMEGAARSEDVTFGNFDKNEEFESGKLGDEWMTLRGPATEFYSLSDKPGFLTLKCIDANASELKELALVTRRLQHHKFEIVSTLYFNPEAEDAAGLLLLKDEGHQYFLSIRKGEEGRKISVEKISFKESEILGSLNISEEGPVTLKIVSDGLTFSFFTVGDTEDIPIAEGVDARYLSTANSFGFTGTTIGLYATKNL